MRTTVQGEEGIYHVARVIQEPGSREKYLDQACGGDAVLRARIEAMLRVCEEESSFLELPACFEFAGAMEREERVGTTIGPYKLLEEIGEGGMGLVYLAEQSQPVRRRVALKILKPGMDSKQVIRRFEAERQALALMDHPNIAKVFDAGTTETCRPYFVMELVRGIPITAYCDRERLTVEERLELFLLVCRAVQHAHQKGIIHRDIKPANVMVTMVDGVAVPKVIDFGVAKAIGQQLTERTLYTGFHQFIGTPLYMSPEQADISAVDVDTRSDIYSLGVLLYELLTGTTPFDQETFRTAAFDEIRRIIREEEPARPSTRLSSLGETALTVSQHRQADVRQLNRAVRGELDWVVMKALEKNRQRRYETCNDLASDLMRYLQDQPVQACPPSAWYRFTKYARRHRVLLTASGVVLATLLGAVSVSVWQAALARAAEVRAENDYRRAREVIDRVVLRVTDDLREVPRSERVRQALLEDALAFYQASIVAHGEDPEVKFEAAKSSMHVGMIHETVGNIEGAESPTRLAIRMMRELVSRNPQRAEYRIMLSRAHTQLAEILGRLDRKPEGNEERRAALAQIEAVLVHDPENPNHLRRLAELRCNLGLGLSTEGSREFEEAESQLREATQIWERIQREFPALPEDPFELARLHLWRGNLFQQTSRHAEAEREYRAGVERLETVGRAGQASHRMNGRIAHILFYLARMQSEDGQLDEAVAILRKVIAHNKLIYQAFPAVEDYQRRLGGAYTMLGFCLWEQGQLAEAESVFEEEVELREEIAGGNPRPPNATFRLAGSLCRLGHLRAESGHFQESVDSFRKAISIYENILRHDPDNAKVQIELAWWLSVGPATPLHDPVRAARLAARAVELVPDNAVAWRVLGVALYRSNNIPAARAALERALTIDPVERTSALFLAMTCAVLGDPDQGRAWYAKGTEGRDSWFSTYRLDEGFAAEAAGLLGIDRFPPASHPAPD